VVTIYALRLLKGDYGNCIQAPEKLLREKVQMYSAEKVEVGPTPTPRQSSLIQEHYFFGTILISSPC